MDTTLGQRIKRVRGDLKQADFAESLGVHKNSLSRYERDSSIPGTDFIEALCTKYGVSVFWLVLGEGSMDGSYPEPTRDSGLDRDATLEEELCAEREMNRTLVDENRMLWKENGELKVKIGELNVQKVKLEGELDTARKMAKEYYERLKSRDAPEDTTPTEAIREAG